MSNIELIKNTKHSEKSLDILRIQFHFKMYILVSNFQIQTLHTPPKSP